MAAGPALMEEDLKLTSRDGTSIGAFLVHSRSGSFEKAILLLTDILGYTNEDTRDVARRMATAGFPTIVPDLFRENPWTSDKNMDDYEKWRATHDPRVVRDDYCAAYEYLKGKDTTNLAMMGFCFGGGRMMEELSLAKNGINPKVAVAFYPTRFDPVEVGKTANCALLFITGDQDELVPLQYVEQLRGTLDENEDMKDLEFQIVTGAGHAFAHHPKSESDEVQSELSFARAEEYLRCHL